MPGLPDRRRLVDVVASLDRLDRDGRWGTAPTIFVERPWSAESPAVILHEQARGGCAPSMPSHSYLLEADVAAEVLAVWTRWHSGQLPSPEEAAEALIHYAIHGAYQPVTCQYWGCGRTGMRSCSSCGKSMCGTHATGSTQPVGCASCAPKPAVGSAASRRTVRSKRHGNPVVWGGLQVIGLLCFAIGWLSQVAALQAGGLCLLVIGCCIWVSTAVMGLMD